ncbi:hypothetical protein [Pseudomonas reactans]
MSATLQTWNTVSTADGTWSVLAEHNGITITGYVRVSSSGFTPILQIAKQSSYPEELELGIAYIRTACADHPVTLAKKVSLNIPQGIYHNTLTVREHGIRITKIADTPKPSLSALT